MARSPGLDSDTLSAGLEALTQTTVGFRRNQGLSASDVHSWLLAAGPVASPIDDEPQVEVSPDDAASSAGSQDGHFTARDAVQRQTKIKADEFVFFVRDLFGKEYRLKGCPSNTSVAVFRGVEKVTGIPVSSQRLIYGGESLCAYGSYVSGKFSCPTLKDYGIGEACTVRLVLRLAGGGPGIVVDRDSLAPRYNFDFTNVCDDGSVFVRGGEVYRRPYGWMRYALAVIGKHSDDRWLGMDGIRKHSTAGEWPVSYHGTNKDGAQSISEMGYLLSKGKRFAFGRAIYTTPDIEVAAKYAADFTVDGRKYQVVLQNRVNPATLYKIPKGETGCGEYWLNERNADVRPYGILIREVSCKRRLFG